MNTDRPFLGILLMLGFCVLVPISDSLAKLLGGQVSLGEIIFARFALQSLILLPLLLWSGTGLRMPAGTQFLTWLRTLTHLVSMCMMFTALRYLPLADTVAIAFVMPFIMLFLGHFVLHETIGPHRIIASGVGFLGTLLVIQPNFVNTGWPALLPVGVALGFAIFMLITRKIANKVDPIKLQTVSGIQATVLLIPLFVLFPNTPALAITMPDQSILLMLLGMGVVGTIAHLFMTWSLRYAPSATLAPMQYLEIPFSTLFGWLIFQDLPNGLAALGICITVAAGLYVIVREQRLSRQPVVPPAV